MGETEERPRCARCLEPVKVGDDLFLDDIGIVHATASTCIYMLRSHAREGWILARDLAARAGFDAMRATADERAEALDARANTGSKVTTADIPGAGVAYWRASANTAFVEHDGTSCLLTREEGGLGVIMRADGIHTSVTIPREVVVRMIEMTDTDHEDAVRVKGQRDRLDRILRATVAGLMGLDDGRTFEGSVDFMEYAPAEALGHLKDWLVATAERDQLKRALEWIAKGSPDLRQLVVKALEESRA